MHTDKTVAWLLGLTTLLVPIRLEAEIRGHRSRTAGSVVEAFGRRNFNVPILKNGIQRVVYTNTQTALKLSAPGMKII